MKEGDYVIRVTSNDSYFMKKGDLLIHIKKKAFFFYHSTASLPREDLLVYKENGQLLWIKRQNVKRASKSIQTLYSLIKI